MLTMTLVILMLFVTACSTGSGKGDSATLPAEPIDPEASAPTAPLPDVDSSEAPLNNTPENPVANPRAKVPDDLFLNFLLPFDGIRPIYEPEFVQAQEAPLEGDELVIGLAWEGKPKLIPLQSCASGKWLTMS